MVQVKVQAAITGERPAQVTLKTDSSVTPEVRFHLNVRTVRKPPFLVQVAGDLCFQDEESYKKGIEFVVSTMQSPRDPLQPRPQFDNPKGSIRLVNIENKPISNMGDTVRRNYTFRLAFSEIPRDLLEAAIRVPDPWNEALAPQQLRIVGKPLLDLEIAPQRIVWKEGRPVDFRVLIRCRDASWRILAKSDDPHFPFVLNPTEETEGQFRVFRLRKLGTDPPAIGTHSLPIIVEGGKLETPRSLLIAVVK